MSPLVLVRDRLQSPQFSSERRKRRSHPVLAGERGGMEKVDNRLQPTKCLKERIRRTVKKEEEEEEGERVFLF